MVFRPGFSVKLVPCSIPNVCVVDLLIDLPIRVIGIYAPESKTWEWNELSPFITPSCVLFGDFNIDIEKDGKKSRVLLDWADMCFLAPIRVGTNTSLRSERTIDYAFTVGVPLSVQALEVGTTSDHKPVLASATCSGSEVSWGRNTHWK
ncbi:unnamed protein product, partial [Didymodactylos carnosus]